VAIEAHGIAEPQDLDILLADDLPHLAFRHAVMPGNLTQGQRRVAGAESERHDPTKIQIHATVSSAQAPHSTSPSVSRRSVAGDGITVDVNPAPGRREPIPSCRRGCRRRQLDRCRHSPI